MHDLFPPLPRPTPLGDIRYLRNDFDARGVPKYESSVMAEGWALMWTQPSLRPGTTSCVRVRADSILVDGGADGEVRSKTG